MKKNRTKKKGEEEEDNSQANASCADAMASLVSLVPMHETFVITSPVAGLKTCHRMMVKASFLYCNAYKNYFLISP